MMTKEAKKRSFNAQIEFTMHEMKCFMIPCEKLMTEEKALKNKNEKRENEIEFINIDTDGRDFLLCLFFVLPSHISLDGLLGLR
jgi:hypothetical protein